MTKKTFDGFYIEELPLGGNCMVLTSSWKDHLYKVIESESVAILRLSEASGWKDSDIEFISNLDSLIGIEIYSWKVKSLAPLLSLKNLKHIGLQCNFDSNFDFSVFQNLELCKIKWSGKVKNLFLCDTIKFLNIVDYPHVDLSLLSKMVNIEKLQLVSRKLESLRGIANLSKLTNLDLSQCPALVSLEGVSLLQNLSSVELFNCKKIHDISLLGEIEHLKKLAIEDCGNISSLVPIANCKELSALLFIGNTFIEDGNFEPLLNLPFLEKMWFANRKHYSHTREKVSEILNAKTIDAKR